MTIPEWNEEQECGKKRILSTFLTRVHLRSSSGGTSISSPTYLPFFFRWRTHSVKRYSIWPLTERTAVVAGTAPAAGDVSTFVERLAGAACCRTVRLTNVERERDAERLVFRIEIGL